MVLFLQFVEEMHLNIIATGNFYTFATLVSLCQALLDYADDSFILSLSLEEVDAN